VRLGGGFRLAKRFLGFDRKRRNGFGLITHIDGALIYVEVALPLIALALLAKKHALGQYKSLAAIFVVLFLGSVAGLVMTHLHPANRHLLYEVYFYYFWSASIVGAILMLMFCYGILTRLFSSLPELRSISTRVFGWIVVFWCVVSARFFFMPNMSAARFLAVEATQLKLLEGSLSLLTAMVVFVCIRPLGLRLRGPLPAFGLGLIFSAMIVFSSPLFRNWAQYYSSIVIFGGVAICAQLIAWVAAISWSEPAQQIVS
jgi:hypothetical protein